MLIDEGQVVIGSVTSLCFRDGNIFSFSMTVLVVLMRRIRRASQSPDAAQKLWILQQNASVYSGGNRSCLAVTGAFLLRKQILAPRSHRRLEIFSLPHLLLKQQQETGDLQPFQSVVNKQRFLARVAET